MERPDVDQYNEDSRNDKHIIVGSDIRALVAWIREIEEDNHELHKQNNDFETKWLMATDKVESLESEVEGFKAEMGYHEAKDVIEQLTAQRDQFKAEYEKLKVLEGKVGDFVSAIDRLKDKTFDILRIKKIKRQ